MRGKKLAAVLGAATVFTTGGIAAATIGAQADSAAPNAAPIARSVTGTPDVGAMAWTCPNGDQPSEQAWCVWRYANPTGNRWRVHWYGADGGYGNNEYSNSSATVNNSASAVWNQESDDWLIAYQYANYEGAYICFRAESRFRNLENVSDNGHHPPGWWNNRISSHRWKSTCSR